MNKKGLWGTLLALIIASGPVLLFADLAKATYGTSSVYADCREIAYSVGVPNESWADDQTATLTTDSTKVVFNDTSLTKGETAWAKDAVPPTGPMPSLTVTLTFTNGHVWTKTLQAPRKEGCVPPSTSTTTTTSPPPSSTTSSTTSTSEPGTTTTVVNATTTIPVDSTPTTAPEVIVVTQPTLPVADIGDPPKPATPIQPTPMNELPQTGTKAVLGLIALGLLCLGVLLILVGKRLGRNSPTY